MNIFLRSKRSPFEVYKLHQDVMGVVCGGGLGLNKESARPLWRSISNGSDGSVLLVRSSQPPLGDVGNVKEQVVSFEAGELRKFNCRLNLSTRTCVEHPLKKKGYKKVERSLDAAEVEGWLTKLLVQHGMALQNAAIVSQSRIRGEAEPFYRCGGCFVYSQNYEPGAGR